MKYKHSTKLFKNICVAFSKASISILLVIKGNTAKFGLPPNIWSFGSCNIQSGLSTGGGTGKILPGPGPGPVIPPQGPPMVDVRPTQKKMFLSKNKGTGGLSFRLCNLCRKLYIYAFDRCIQAIVFFIRMCVPENPRLLLG